jgi:acetyl-CoA synthetase
MSNIIDRYYKEIKDGSGRIVKIENSFGENFNFAYDVVDEYARISPEKTALIHKGTNGVRTVFTFGEMKTLSDKAANVFRSLGIGRGDPVMLLMKRRYQFWISILALHKLGAVAVPTSHMVSAEDIRERCEAAKVKAVICVNSENICEKVKEAIEGSGILQIVTGESFGDAYDLDKMIGNAPEAFERVKTRVFDDMLYYFTSGTSGSPKAVIHDHSYPIAHIYTAKNWHGASEGDLHLTVADSGWAKSAWGKLYGQWFVGASIMVYDYDNFFASDMLRLIQEERINTFCAPPTIYKYFLLEDLGSYDLSSLKAVTTAGEPMPPAVAEKFTAETGLVIREGFGQTETALQICTPVGEKAVKGSIGRVSPLYHVELVDEDGKKVKDGEEGEIVLIPEGGRSPLGVFKGYLGDEKLYSEAWEGGVYHTKDKAYKDKEGNFFFLGRNDDVIKSSGYRIGPSEVEDILMQHPAVFACAVTGYPSQKRGEIVKASIVLKEGFTGDNALKTEIQDFVKERAAIYKYPRMIVFAEALPLTSNGKISRAAIRRADHSVI